MVGHDRDAKDSTSFQGEENGNQDAPLLERSHQRAGRVRPDDVLALIAEVQGRGLGEDVTDVLFDCEENLREDMLLHVTGFVACMHSYDRIRQETLEALRMVQQELMEKMDATEKYLMEGFVVKASRIIDIQRQNKLNNEKLRRWDNLYAFYQATSENIGELFE